MNCVSLDRTSNSERGQLELKPFVLLDDRMTAIRLFRQPGEASKVAAIVLVKRCFKMMQFGRICSLALLSDLLDQIQIRAPRTRSAVTCHLSILP